MVKVQPGNQDYYMDGYLKSNMQIIKDLINDQDHDFVGIVDGFEGCLAGDTVIQLTRNKLSRRYTIKHLFNFMNGNPQNMKHYKPMNPLNPSFVRSFNGTEIRLHKMLRVLYSGKKPLYQIRLEDGRTIKATATHRFLLRDGWQELRKLNINDQLMCDTLHPTKTNRKRIKLKDVALTVHFHPYKNKRSEVEVHRLIYEAYMNDLKFLEYLDILLNEKDIANTLSYVDPKIYHIHHRDGNHYNNDVKNLQKLTVREHSVFHSSYSNFSQGTPIFKKIVDIKYIGVDDTYDIQCTEPHHNFVANGVVVHNSGKSVLAMQIGYYIDPSLTLDRVCFTSTEYRDAVKKAKKGQCVIYDEAITGAFNREAIQQMNVILIKMMAQVRQKNLFMLLVLPSFFDLDKNLALWRSKFVVHVTYGKRFQRGYFKFANLNKKKDIYVKGQKTYYYPARDSAWNFKGRFTKHYTMPERAYKNKKSKSFEASDYRVVSARKARSQRDSLITILLNIGFTQAEVAYFSDLFNEGLTQRQVGNVALKFKKLENSIDINILKSIKEKVKGLSGQEKVKDKAPPPIQ